MNYLLLPKIQVENANAIAGFTWGFPAITQFLGYVHALSRVLAQKEEYPLRLGGCAVICHEQEVFAHKNDYGRYTFAQARYPVKKDGKPASINPEGRMHLTVSLLIECEGELENAGLRNQEFARYMHQLCLSKKLAGGTIVAMEEPQLLTQEKRTFALKKLMPAYVLYDRHEYLQEHHAQHPEKTMFEAWMDFIALRYQANKDEEDNVTWKRLEKPKAGYLIPLMCGYQRLLPVYEAGTVKSARDNSTPFAFVEAVYSVGEWRGLHHLYKQQESELAHAIWRYRTTETGYYCQASATAKQGEQFDLDKYF